LVADIEEREAALKNLFIR